MGHKGYPVILITFAISGACSAFSTEFSTINKYVGQMLVNSYYNCVENLFVCWEFQESASIPIGSVEYRATLKLILRSEVGAGFARLVCLLVHFREWIVMIVAPSEYAIPKR